METTQVNKLMEVAQRIREMREIAGYTPEEMAVKTDVTVHEYLAYERGEMDFPFTFIHKCSLAFNVGITDLMEGSSARLTSYTVTRKGMGQLTADEGGHDIRNLAPLFNKKIAEPYFVRYAYDEKAQNEEIPVMTHSGQEFDYIVSGTLKVRVGDHIEVLTEGDSIYYDSATPHGMIAVGGHDCVFVAVVLPGEEVKETQLRRTVAPPRHHAISEISRNFIETVENADGSLKNISFKNADKFNFAFDVVDELAKRDPDKMAMLHLTRDKEERRFTFKDISRESSRVANYLKALGIKKGDRVMLVLKRHYQFWFAILALHKLGAVVVPATNMLQQKDYEYRFNAGEIRAIICTADGDAAQQVDLAHPQSPSLEFKLLVGGKREGWHDFDEESALYSSRFRRPYDAACGSDDLLMFFTSGTTGEPKMTVHNHAYPLGHYVTAKYWHCVDPDGLHFTISDTGWGKALWGKLYGQWLCEAAVLVYDFDKFDAKDILTLFAKHQITTFCAPPTMYRFMIREDLEKYDLSSLQRATIAGEALNPEVFNLFQKATGLQLAEGFGQTETTLTIANLRGMTPKPGSMGKPVPGWKVDIVDANGNPCPTGEVGEIVVHTDERVPCGLFKEYFRDKEHTLESWHDNLYHTGDTAWRDEDGYFWYVGRTDDVIKSSGYRIGPFEIESVIMELPYVLECGVSAAPDPVRGQVVKASVVLKGKEPSDELKKEIQDYVKHRTAPYKYPRIVVFRDSLPKTISGKIQHNKL